MWLWLYLFYLNVLNLLGYFKLPKVRYVIWHILIYPEFLVMLDFTTNLSTNKVYPTTMIILKVIITIILNYETLFNDIRIK